MPVVLRELRVARLDVGRGHRPGRRSAVALDGSGELTSPTDFSGTLNVRQLDGAGSYAVTGTTDATRLQATLQAERAGPWPGRRHLAGLPDLGAVAIAAQPRRTTRCGRHPHVTLAAGPLHATAGGTLDLEHDGRRPDGVRRSAGHAAAPGHRLAGGGDRRACARSVRSARMPTGRLHIDALSTAGIRIDSIHGRHRRRRGAAPAGRRGDGTARARARTPTCSPAIR